MASLKKFPTQLVVGLLLLTILVAAHPNAAKLLPTERAIALFLDTGILTPTPPGPGPAKTAPMINATVGATNNNLCLPPTVDRTVPPNTPAANTVITVANTAVTTSVSAGATAPTWIPTTTSVQATPVPPQNCPNVWGTWKPPAPFKTGRQVPPANDPNNYPPSSMKYPEPVLHLWLTSTQNVSLVSFQAKVCKTPACGVALFTFQFDLQGTLGNCPTTSTQVECFAGANLHSDPTTGQPALLIRRGESIPITLTPSAAWNENQVATTDNPALVFDRITTLSTNGTAPVVGPQPQNTAGTLLVQYGNADKASAVSFPILPSSTHANAKQLGFFLSNVGDERILSTDFPKPGTPSSNFSFPVQPAGAVNPPDAPLPPPPIVLGRAVADTEYILRGNALVKVYYTVQTINEQIEGLKKSPTAFLAEVRFEVNLTIGDKIIKSNVGSLRAGLDYHRVSSNTNTAGPGATPVAKKVVTFGLPTAGLVLDAGTPITLSVTVQGSDAAGKLYIYYGSPDLPTGFKIPATLAVAEPTLVSGLSVSARALTDPALGAGATNGSFSLFADRLSARVHPGGDDYFGLTLRNQGNRSVPFELNVTGGRGQRTSFDPQRGTIESGVSIQSYLKITITPSTLAGPKYFNVTAKFNRSTPVGPIPLVLVVDQDPDNLGIVAATPRVPGGEGSGEASGDDARGGPKALSGAKSPAFELYVLLGALLVGVVAARRRRE